MFEKLEKFLKETIGEIRVVLDANGEIWFYGVDVAVALGYAKPGNAISTHVDEEDRLALSYKEYAGTTVGKLWEGNDFSNKIIINESGMYSLIFSSQLSTAKEFKNWVTREVLPSIRMNGGYIYGQESLPKAERDELIKEIRDKYKEVTEKLTRISTYWHKAVAERNTYKAKARDYKARMKSYRDDSNDWFNAYLKVLDDLTKASDEIEVLKIKSGLVPKPVYKSNENLPGVRYHVTADGLVVFR